MNFFIDEEILKKLYVDEQLAINKIAEKLGVSVGKVFNDIKKYGIETRKTLTHVQRKAISDSLKGKPSAAKGRHHSDKAKRKMSEAKKIHGSGHKKIRDDGYVALYYPEYPKSNSEGYVMEHRFIMEQHIGRFLNDDEVVHHINHIRSDNRLSNLALMTVKEHMSLHMKERWEEKRRKKNGTQ